MKMIAKKADDRYQTPQEVADVLKPWAEGTAKPGPASPPVKATLTTTTTKRPETLSNVQDETGKIPAKPPNGIKKKTAADTAPAVAKTGRIRIDAPGNTALRGKTKIDKDEDAKDARDSGRRLKKKKKNFTPLIIVASAAGLFLLIGVGLMIWAMTRTPQPIQPKGVPGVPVATGTPTPTPTPNPLTKTPDPTPTPPTPVPKPPDPVKPPPPPPPPAPTITADFFPYKPGLTLNYVEVNYINEGLGVALHQKSEFKDGGLIETTSTKAGMVQGGKYLGGKPVEWNATPQFLKKFKIRLGKVPQVPHFRVEGPNAEIGIFSSGLGALVWEPVLKLGAKQGETWEHKLPNGTTKKYTLERFEKKDGKDAVVVKSQMTVQQDTELITYSTYARGIGEVERISNVQQKDKLQTVTELKLVPE